MNNIMLSVAFFGYLYIHALHIIMWWTPHMHEIIQPHSIGNAHHALYARYRSL